MRPEPGECDRDRGDLNAAMLDAGRIAPGCISDAPAVERALCGKSCRRASP